MGAGYYFLLSSVVAEGPNLLFCKTVPPRIIKGKDLVFHDPVICSLF